MSALVDASGQPLAIGDRVYVIDYSCEPCGLKTWDWALNNIGQVLEVLPPFEDPICAACRVPRVRLLFESGSASGLTRSVRKLPPDFDVVGDWAATGYKPGQREAQRREAIRALRDACASGRPLPTIDVPRNGSLRVRYK